MKQKIALTRKKESIVDKKQKALAFKNQNGNFPAFYNENAIETQIKQCEVQIDAIEKEFLSGKSDKFCGIAFVTFNTEYDKLQCLKTHYKTFRQRIYNYFLDTFKKFLKKKINQIFSSMIKDWSSLKLRNPQMSIGKTFIILILTL